MPAESLHNLSDCFEHQLPAGSRRIAWDGLSFCVPSNWELAVYRFMKRGASRIELEDEYSVRLEAEWVRGKKGLRLERIMERYEAASKPLTLKSDERREVKGLPEGWHATHFVFKETGGEDGEAKLRVTRHDLVTAFYLCPRSSVFCFFLLHFLPEDREGPAETVRRLARTFQDHGEDEVAPWQLFDISFKLPREFSLKKAQFDIGSKLMVFGWKGRRLHLWHFSCAGMFLKDGGRPAEWAVGHLNAYRGIRGQVFRTAGDGGITWRRHWSHPLGHRSEIARFCFRYEVGWLRREAEDQLVVWVFNYRRESDRAMLPILR